MPNRLVVRALTCLAAVTTATAAVAVALTASQPAGATFALMASEPAPATRAPGARPRALAAELQPAGPVSAVAAVQAPVAVPSVLRAVAELPAEPLSARRVVLYGDSLAWQSQAFFVAAVAGAGITHVTTRTFGGTAICDWFGQMRADAAALHPDVVVVEFSGNALTPCMKALDGSPLSGAAYFEKYAADAATVLDIFTPGRTNVFFAGAPISRRAELANDPTTPMLHAIYGALAQSSPYGRYIDAGASVLLGGRWTETLPCLPAEPCTGGRDANGTPVNLVRAPDGAHFCPGAPAAVRGVTAACTVWSSGSWRFGNAMAAPVITELAARAGA